MYTKLAIVLSTVRKNLNNIFNHYNNYYNSTLDQCMA